MREPQRLVFRCTPPGPRHRVVVAAGRVVAGSRSMMRYRGQSWHEVRRALLAAGWEVEEVDEVDDP